MSTLTTPEPTPPGSFTKNAGWGNGQGFNLLAKAIYDGFENKEGKPHSTKREDWRSKNGQFEYSNQALIPLNFFLFHQNMDMLLVDELVHVAFKTKGAPSTQFDALALFALNLGQGGRNGRTAQWANSFIKDKLWNNGGWSHDHEKSFLNEFKSWTAARLDCSDGVKHKVATNYNFIFNNVIGGGIINGKHVQYNPRYGSVLDSAIRLSWDRLANQANLQIGELLSILKDEAVYKLVGAPSEDVVIDRGLVIAADYIAEKGIRRIAYETKKEIAPVLITPEIQEEGYEEKTPERKAQVSWGLVRDQNIVRELKDLYKDCCVFCGEALVVGEEQTYSEGGHIKPLGNPHKGSDTKDNIIPLCPNHHKQFDNGYISIKEVSGEYVKHRLQQGEYVSTGKSILLKHAINPEYVDYHFDYWSKRELT